MNILFKKNSFWLLGLGLLLIPGYFLLKASQPKVDLIVFSYDRPLQLYAFLESTQKYVEGVGKTIVIYRSSDAAYHAAYAQVQTAFPWVTYWEQGAYPQLDFKPLVMKALHEGSSAYVIFAVDDNVVKDYVKLVDCVKALEKTDAYGVYLKMGTHLTECYSCSAPQSVPALTRAYGELYTWQFAHSAYDWGYPNTVDMTIYRKDGVIKDFSSFSFTNPNTLEGNWSMLAGKVAHRKGLCFAESKIVNLPLNRVQNEYRNRNMESLTARELLDLFNQGLKMDINPLYKIKNPGVHMAYVPKFIAR